VVVLDPAHPAGHGEHLADRHGVVPAAGELRDELGHAGVEVGELSAVGGDAGEQGQRRLRGGVAEQPVLRGDTVGVPLVDEHAVDDDHQGGRRGRPEERREPRLASVPDDAALERPQGGRPRSR
jgi:hypothetical protein